MLRCGYGDRKNLQLPAQFLPQTRIQEQESRRARARIHPFQQGTFGLEHNDLASSFGWKKSSELTSRPTDVPLGNLFLDNQLASRCFGDFGKNVVNDIIGLGNFFLLNLELLEKRLIELKGL